jgi:decaprenyl-phosphate phosphoribosyltransferase
MPEQLDTPTEAATSPAPTTPTAGPARPGFLLGCIRTARPKQWAKNVLVFAAPAAAGVLLDGPVVVRTLIAFAAFCLAASGTYFLNDAMDATADRAHPTKRNRPIAAGVISRPVAYVIAGVLMVAGLGIAVPVQNGNLTIVIAVYLAFTVSYSLGLKREPVLELAMVAAGFVLRAVGGAVAANVALSRWFLIVAGGGSLLVVAGKRFGELAQLGNREGTSRSVLKRYTPTFLRQVCTISAAVTVTAYCLWAFANADGSGDAAIWFELSIIPFVVAVLRYALISDHGDAGAPEDVLLNDKMMLFFGLLWAICFGVGITIG